MKYNDKTVIKAFREILEEINEIPMAVSQRSLLNRRLELIMNSMTPEKEEEKKDSDAKENV